MALKQLGSSAQALDRICAEAYHAHMPEKHCKTCRCYPDPVAQAMARKRWAEKDERAAVKTQVATATRAVRDCIQAWATPVDPSHADVAPTVEHPTRNGQVAGSTPAVGSRPKLAGCVRHPHRADPKCGFCVAG